MTRTDTDKCSTDLLDLNIIYNVGIGNYKLNLWYAELTVNKWWMPSRRIVLVKYLLHLINLVICETYNNKDNNDDCLPVFIDYHTTLISRAQNINVANN